MVFFSGMVPHYSLNQADSGMASDKYFEVNNFGYSRNLENDVITNRPWGRPDYQLIYVKCGKLVVTVDSVKISVLTGQAFLFKPMERQFYCYSACRDAEYLWFHFSGYGCEELLSGLFDNGRVIEINDSYEIDKAMKDMCSHCRADYRFLKEFACGRMIMLFATLKQSKSQRDPAIEKVLAQLHREKFGEGSNDVYAKIANMSESHFMRRFVAYTGIPPHKYKMKYLLGQAAELLCDTEMNVKEVSYTVGIDDSLYFGRIFKKEYGVSPLCYKKKHNSQKITK